MTEGTYTDPLKVGDHFGDYVVERQLGSGAMGAVYLVRAPDDSLFAVKIMFPGKMTHDLRSRFAREADFAMKIRHRNLISVYDVGEDPDTGLCYIIMDYVPGGTLADRIKARGKLPVDEAVKIAMQIAAGLDVAHKNGLVHRDVKPDNIMFDADGTPKLADLGVAKFDDDRKTMVTMTGMVIGTPAYMSPEQLMDSHRIDARADIYSLGVVLYEMLAGTRPNSNSTAVELLAKAIKGEELPDIRKMCPEISAAVAHVLSLMCASKPEERPATSIEAANLLHKAVTGKLALPKKPPKSAAEIMDEKAAKRKRAIAVWMVVAGLLMFLVVGLAGIAYAVLRYYAEEPARPQSVATETVEDSTSIDSMVVTNVVEKIVVATNGIERAVDMTNVNAQGGNPAQTDKFIFNKAVPKFKMQVHANDLTWLKKSFNDDQSRPVRVCHDFSHGGFPSLGQAFYRSVFEKIKGFESKACWYDLTSENLSWVNVLFLPSAPAQLLYDDKECDVIDEFMQKGGTVIVETGEQDNDIWRINKLLSRYGLEVFVADEYRTDSKAGRKIARKVSTCCMALDGLTPEFRFCTFAAPMDGEGEKSWSCLAHVNERPVIAARSVGKGHLLFSSVGWKWWKDGVGQMDHDASEMWKRIILSAVESKPIPLKAPIGQRPCTDAPVILRAGPISIYTSRMFKKNAEKLREIVIQALPHLERRCGKVLNPEEMPTTKFILSGTSIWGYLPVGYKTIVTSATFRGFPDKIGFLSRFIFERMVSNALGNSYLSRYFSTYVALLVLGDLGFPEELTKCIDEGRQRDNDFTKYHYTDKGLVDKNGEKVEDKNNFIANAKFLSAFEEIRSRHADFVERFTLQLKLQPSRFFGMSESVVLLSAATGEGCISIFERYGIECRHNGYAGVAECVPDSGSKSKTTKSSSRRITDRRVRYAKVDGITWYYTLDDGEAVIWRGQNGYNNETRPALDPSDMEHIVVPAEIDGYKVSSIGSLAFFRCRMKSVVIPEGVRRIAGWAFYDCNRLKDIRLPSSLDTLASSPFSSCKSLTSIDIGNCSNFSGSAFGYCPISHVTVSESNPSCRAVGDCLYSRDMRKLIFFPRTGSSVTLPESVDEIGEGAFLSCNMLQKVKIGGNVVKIGASAFSMCGQLSEIELSPGLREVGNRAFAWSALRNITFPSSVEKIGTSLFDRCRSLRTVQFLGDAPKIDMSRTSVLGSVPECLEIVVRRGTRGWKETNSEELPERWPDGGFDDSRKIRFTLADEAPSRSDDKNKHEVEKPQDRKSAEGTPTKPDLSFLRIVTSKGQEALSNNVLGHRVIEKLIKDLDLRMGNSLLSGLKGKELQIVVGGKKDTHLTSAYKDGFHLHGISRHEDVFSIAMWLMAKATGGGWGPRQTGVPPIYPIVEGVLFQDVADVVVPNILGYRAGAYQRRSMPQQDLDFVLKYDPQMDQYDFNGKPIGKQSSRKIAKQLASRLPQAKIKWVVNELSRTHDAILAKYFRARHEARLSGLINTSKYLSLDDFAALMSIAAQEDLFRWFSDHGMSVSPEKTKIKVPEAVQITETSKKGGAKTILIFPNADTKVNKWKMRTPWRYTTKWPDASNWFTVKFDDGKWNQTRKPVGIGKDKDLMRIADKLKVKDRSVWLRRHFSWKPAAVHKVVFHMIYDSQITMYLNGEKILERDDSNTWWQSFHISIDKFQNAVREGDNVLAVCVKGQSSLYFDCGMMVEVEDKNE